MKHALPVTALVAFLPCLTLAAPIRQKGQTTGVQEVRAGLVELKKGDLKTAEIEFQEALRKNPKQTAAMVGLAEIALQRNRPVEASSFLSKALAADPDNLDLHRTWANFLIGQGRSREAESAYKIAVSRNPNDPLLHQDMGDLYLVHLKRIPEAITAFQHSIALKPDSFQAHMGLASALVTSGNLPAAEKEFYQAAKIDSKSGAPFLALGLAYAEKKEFDRALPFYARSLSLQPSLLPARMANGDAYLAKGDTARALAEYQSAASAAPKDAGPQVRIGDLHASRGNHVPALSAYRAALKLDSELAGVQNNMAFLLISHLDTGVARQRQLDEALDAAKMAVRLAPKSPDFLDTLGWVLRARGDLAVALQTLQKASALAPKNPEIVKHLATVRTEIAKLPPAKRGV